MAKRQDDDLYWDRDLFANTAKHGGPSLDQSPEESIAMGFDYVCPKCHQRGRFKVEKELLVTSEMEDDGSPHYYTHWYWSHASQMRCVPCGHQARVHHFIPTHSEASCLIISDKLGLYLGQKDGVHYWSHGDTGNRDRAQSLDLGAADWFPERHPYAGEIRSLEIPICPSQLSAPVLDYYGLSQYTAPLHANTRIAAPDINNPMRDESTQTFAITLDITPTHPGAQITAEDLSPGPCS